MPAVGSKPNNYCFQVLINACGRAGYTKKAFQLYNQVCACFNWNIPHSYLYEGLKVFVIIITNIILSCWRFKRKNQYLCENSEIINSFLPSFALSKFHDLRVWDLTINLHHPKFCVLSSRVLCCLDKYLLCLPTINIMHAASRIPQLVYFVDLVNTSLYRLLLGSW